MRGSAAAQDEAESPGLRFALAVVWPQVLVLVVVVVAAILAGQGWSLVLLLALAFVLSLAVASLIWKQFLRWRSRPNYLLGAMVGLIAGIAAAALSYGAVAADLQIGPHFGGSLITAAIKPVIEQSFKAGVNSARAKDNPAVNVATIPLQAMFGFGFAIFAAGAMVAFIFGAIALPIISGLVAGITATRRARRRYQ